MGERDGSTAESIHFKWVVRYWPAGDESSARFQVCDDEQAARSVRHEYRGRHGFDADMYQLISPHGCRHCPRDDGGRCYCQNDE